MNFLEAIKLMQLGKKVRCSRWVDKELYIYLDEDNQIISRKEGKPVEWLCVFQYSSTDWEEYKPDSFVNKIKEEILEELKELADDYGDVSFSDISRVLERKLGF